MDREQASLPGPAVGGPVPGTGLGRPAEARASARIGHVQAGCLQQQQREEQVSLETEHQPGQGPSRPRLGFAERQRADRDSGSTPSVFGWAWWRLCLLTHQP